MKTESILLLGIAGFILYEWMQRGTVGGGRTPYTYPPTPTRPGSTTGAGGGGSGGILPFGGGRESSQPGTSGYVCDDGTLVNDPSLCTGTAGFECPDGTLVNDPSLCTSQFMDTMDPCDPNSSAYDPSQCGAPGDTVYDSGDPCDINSMAYDESLCFGML